MFRGVVLLFIVAFPAWGAPVVGCGPAIAAAEQAEGTAPGLLAAIGVVESGRRDARTGLRAPWPWTVTAEGVGTFYRDKAQAILAVRGLQALGITSVDVGCMQVNLMHHPAAFLSLEAAFEPSTNARAAARFLGALFKRLGTWPAAAAGYHSLTPTLGAEYGRLIAAVWGGAPVPVVAGPGGTEIVRFPGGGQMRLVRDEAVGPGRVLGYLSGP